MTPFESWYAAEVEINLPADFPPQLAATAKAQMAKCWTAGVLTTLTVLGIPDSVVDTTYPQLRARVTP